MRMLSKGRTKVAFLTVKPVDVANPTVAELNGGIPNAADFIPSSRDMKISIVAWVPPSSIPPFWVERVRIGGSEGFPLVMTISAVKPERFARRPESSA